MRILAIETSSEHASIALICNDEITERTLEGHANHSEKLLPSVRELLADSAIGLHQLDGIAFGAGPGAFTGLRLACAAAQGLAMGAGLGVVGVCSLEALSLQGEGDAVLVATDARMGEIYTAAYEMLDGAPALCGAIACIPPQEFQLPEHGRRWFGVGSAFLVHGEVLAERGGAGLQIGLPYARVRASDIGRLAAARVAHGAAVQPEHAAPLYVRNKVALTIEERRERGGRA
ncbi:MAG TPA: tRNA (adenosine(37)-N6)-threonylcarbamoyltransferase complex dimerization subunit type 1 TsaB [Azoarcus taiwanensis]|nr:tRNA (adenosine(37)-N6)-threonylcarbamoyltransferase complex dimerization subunit type 1 TsaB [Azoarcus taiwanensis]